MTSFYVNKKGPLRHTGRVCQYEDDYVYIKIPDEDDGRFSSSAMLQTTEDPRRGHHGELTPKWFESWTCRHCSTVYKDGRDHCKTCSALPSGTIIQDSRAPRQNTLVRPPGGPHHEEEDDDGDDDGDEDDEGQEEGGGAMARNQGGTDHQEVV